MEVTMIITCTIVGILIGIVATDFVHRFALRKNVENVKTEMEEAIKMVAKEHNSMAQKLLEMQDFISAHEYKLNGRRPTLTKDG